MHGDLQTETHHLPPDEMGTQVTISLSPTGKELERVISRRDAQSRVVECTNVSETGKVHLTARYDQEGNVIGGRAGLPGGTEIMLPINPNPAYQVVTRDVEGNWTERKTPFAILYRTIEYF